MILIGNPEATVEELMGPVQGPDFPTGGIIVESPRSIREAYTTGRGSMRVRARGHVEDQGRGTYVIVVSEIPYQVQKSKLVDQIAGIINDTKLPILAAVRDERDAELRQVLEQRARTVEAVVMMASMF